MASGKICVCESMTGAMEHPVYLDPLFEERTQIGKGSGPGRSELPFGGLNLPELGVADHDENRNTDAGRGKIVDQLIADVKELRRLEIRTGKLQRLKVVVLGRFAGVHDPGVRNGRKGR